MKFKITLAMLSLAAMPSLAQAPSSAATGSEFVFNAEKSACLNEGHRHDIISQLNTSMASLKQDNNLAFSEETRSNHPLFIWPVQKANNVDYNKIWAVSFYVDHNSSAPNQLTDYNCGTRSYDTPGGYNHQGLDIFGWPFNWFSMDNDQAEIIAAAPGQIIFKSDGNFDRSCDFNTTTPWNAVYIQHSDGSIAWYGHLKSGSLTTKNVGDMVAAGEFLGVMGSSGISTGPHLHFEIFTDNTYTQLVDPYAGSCNSMNTESWWQTQKPYRNPGVNAVLTHSAPPVFDTCPTTEIPNIETNFDESDSIIFAIYLKDQTPGTSVNLRVLRPDNSVVYDWDFALNDDFQASWWYWNFSNIFNMNGDWTWEATYNGQTVSTNFTISGVLSTEDEDFNTTSVHPNPVNERIDILSKSVIERVEVFDITGKLALTKEADSTNSLNSLDVSQLSKGIYFLRVFGAQESQLKILKIVKE